jgi:GntR family transcriptional repressor for pyruvate dehydrogenase complex
MKSGSASLDLGHTRKRNLGAELADRLRDEIRAGVYAAGEKLPSEFELMNAAGVSRAVVREAVSALRASGFVETKQGVGAFVTESGTVHTFRLGPEYMHDLQKVLDVLELRMGIEVEAVALAAQRRSQQQLEVIWAAYDEIDKVINRGEVAVGSDFHLHQCIAQATCNPSFADFMEFLGPVVIPRQTVHVRFRSNDEQALYLQMIQAEHRRIVEAIGRQDVAAAREAMRIHLVDGRERYRKLQEQAQTPPK